MTFQICSHPEIATRLDLADYCRKNNLGKVVEVGVDRGVFAAQFLERWAEYGFGRIYLGVDPYEPYGEMNWERDADLFMASLALSKYPIAKIAKAKSVDVAFHAEALRNKHGLYGAPFDMVYLDGGHTYDEVVLDIKYWYHAVRSGGIFVGHDWSMYSGEHEGVKEAVTQFANANDLHVYFTAGDDPQSWIIHKP